MEKNFDYQNSVVKELLKQAVKLGYKDTVSVMLAGDINHSIRLMKWQRFQERKEFVEAYDMIKETVADVINSWVEGCKDDLRHLLDQGIEIDFHKMDKENLIFQLEYLEKKAISRLINSQKNSSHRCCFWLLKMSILSKFLILYSTKLIEVHLEMKRKMETNL